MTTKAIIFDCWNTLIHTKSGHSTFSRIAHNALHAPYNYKLLKRIEQSLQLAPESDVKAAARKLLKDLRIPANPLILSRLEAILKSPSASHEPYRDALETLDELKRQGYKLGLLTNTYQISFEHLIAEYGFDQRFEVIMPSYSVGMIKPDPALFELMLEKLEVEAGEAIMVGDSLPDDIQGAEVAGITGILIDRGNYHRDYPNRIEELSELTQLLVKV
jgi:2-haloalkanoic acid dehalogenase type II